MPLYFKKLLDYLQISLNSNEALFDFYKEESKVIENERLWFAYEKSYDILSMLKQNGIKTGLGSLLINPYGRDGIEEIDDVPVISNISGLPDFLNDHYKIELV